MLYSTDLNCTLSLEKIKVFGTSNQEAMDTLKKMTLAEIIHNGCLKDMSVNNIRMSCLCKTIKVKVTNIDFDVEEEDFILLSDEEFEQKFPDELTLEVEVDGFGDDITDDIEASAIVEAVSDATGWAVNSCQYEILSER